MPIKENEIIIPALVVMAESPNGEITTTSLISYRSPWLSSPIVIKRNKL